MGIGLNYISAIMECLDLGLYCVAVAATSSNNIDQNIWTYPFACANFLDPDVDDGPGIAFDSLPNRLWLVANELGGTGCPGLPPGDAAVCLYIYNYCLAGAPGGTQCPLSTVVRVASSASVVDHATVIADPSHQYGIVAYRDTDGCVNFIWYNAQGALVSAFTTCGYPTGSANDCTTSYPNEAFVPFCEGTQCGSPGCWRIASKVHMEARSNGSGRFHLFASWDKLCGPATDGKNHFKAHVEVMDITGGHYNWTQIHEESSDCSIPSNEFQAVVTANQYTQGFGYFFYEQPAIYGQTRPCLTSYAGRVATSVGVALDGVAVSGSTFPSMWFPGTWGPGHYTAAIRRGLSGGWLFPTWAEPVPTVRWDYDSCPVCYYAGRPDEYSLQVMGARVLP